MAERELELEHREWRGLRAAHPRPTSACSFLGHCGNEAVMDDIAEIVKIHDALACTGKPLALRAGAPRRRADAHEPAGRAGNVYKRGYAYKWAPRGVVMTDLTQTDRPKGREIDYLTVNEIRICHRGDKLTLRGPVHVLVRHVKEDGKEKKNEELVLRTPTDNRTFVNEEKEGDSYDIIITDLGELPQAPTILDLVLDRKHLEIVNTSMFVGKHRDDMVRLRGPARFRLEYKDKHGKVTRPRTSCSTAPPTSASS